MPKSSHGIKIAHIVLILASTASFLEERCILTIVWEQPVLA